LFLDKSILLMNELRDAITDHRPDRLNEAAHSLKGSMAHFGARTAVNAARTLEEMGRHGDLTGAPQTFATLEAEINRLRPALAELLTVQPVGGISGAGHQE